MTWRLAMLARLCAATWTGEDGIDGHSLDCGCDPVFDLRSIFRRHQVIRTL
jgi:hypothetical protein